jgi:hypothetical protein
LFDALVEQPSPVFQARALETAPGAGALPNKSPALEQFCFQLDKKCGLTERKTVLKWKLNSKPKKS